MACTGVIDRDQQLTRLYVESFAGVCFELKRTRKGKHILRLRIAVPACAGVRRVFLEVKRAGRNQLFHFHAPTLHVRVAVITGVQVISTNPKNSPLNLSV